MVANSFPVPKKAKTKRRVPPKVKSEPEETSGYSLQTAPPAAFYKTRSVNPAVFSKDGTNLAIGLSVALILLIFSFFFIVSIL